MYCVCLFLFFFKQKTAYEMRISDWSSDVCSSDLRRRTTEAVMAIPLTGRRLNVGSDTALPLHAGVQLVALGVRQGGVALAEVGALLVVQDAALLGLIASGQCQQQAGRDDRCKLPKTHCLDRKSTRLNSSHSCAS